ncbi:MAG TPA: DAK2 domain-containing protein [Candidatus Choladousia intestinigallinarum]|nr:DAK2 domain-containing protein [Candidatus Choladousia intestinigallinarum]
MNTNTIDASLCAKMFLAGAKNLEAKKEWINELNVFPVPDGDTGTNMTMTIMSAAKEVAAIQDMNMEALSKAISSGSLRGARGNSGVILSQLFRGFCKVIRSEKEITAPVLAASFQKAVETAYKAVMKPKEGTILTVAKGAAEEAVSMLEENPDIDLDSMIQGIIAKAEEVLAMTPEMLPVLKEAGVVDSGGQGLVQVLKGAYDGFLGKEIDYSIEGASSGESRTSGQEAPQAEIKFGYCTEFIIMLEKEYTRESEQEFKGYLESLGDSIVVVSDEELVKVHVHTNDPGLAIQKALTYGSLTKIKIDNMREEHQEKVIREAEKKAQEQKSQEPPKETGFIAVSIGAGIGEVFHDLGVDYLIEGGQTMNPSTEDMLKAIEAVNAKNIFIFPNNKNIILAANQAKSMTKDKNIIVIPTKTVPQGITAIVNYVSDKSPEENAAVMEEEISRVKTGQLTYAVRDTHIEDKVIQAGDIMGVGDHEILAVGKELEPVAKETVRLMVDDSSELISIYYGEDMKEDEAEKLRDQIEELYPDCDVELNYGGQPIYYYIISVE